MQRGLRIGGIVVLAVLVLGLGAGVAGYFLLGGVELASFAAARATAHFGRTVTIGSLRVTPGRWLGIEARDVRLQNVAGGSAADMVTLRQASAEVDALSLLNGPLVVRAATVEGLAVLLEHVGDAANWRFGARGPGGGRTGFPSLRDVQVRDSALVFRTRGGTRLVARVAEGALQSAADDQPVRLTAAGTYRDTPLQIVAELQPTDAYRAAAAPYGTVIHLQSGGVRLSFDGTMTDPLALDGAVGTLVLDAPTLGPVFGVAGVSSGFDRPLRLSGAFQHSGALWWLQRGTGALDDSPVSSASLRLIEGARPRPDDVAVSIAFDRLDLNDLLGTGQRGRRTGADVTLAPDRSPDTLISVRLTARRLLYDALDATDAVAEGSNAAGRIAVTELSMTAFGSRVKASGQVEASGPGGHVTAEGVAAGLDVQTLRRALGFGAVPVSGRLELAFLVDAVAPGLNAAVRGARVSGLAAMRSGAISKEVVEMASTDVRALFRSAKGDSAITCLLAGVDMRGGVGTVAPLRVRAADGTIAGSARFDLNRRVFDLTFGSDGETTGLLALDIPLQVSGPFGNPGVKPARWTAEGRALLAAADNIGQLPPALRDMARRYPCPPTRRG